MHLSNFGFSRQFFCHFLISFNDLFVFRTDSIYFIPKHKSHVADSLFAVYLAILFFHPPTSAQNNN